MENKNFRRISTALKNKCLETNYALGFSEGFSDFVSKKGLEFFEYYGKKKYLKTARFYFNLLKEH